MSKVPNKSHSGSIPETAHRVELGGQELPVQDAVFVAQGDDFELRFRPWNPQVVGDRLVPDVIEVTIYASASAPAFEGRIEVINGVPRWASVALRRGEDGQEIRRKHLDAVDLDGWIEWAVSHSAAKINAAGTAPFPPSSSEAEGTRRAVQSLRVGSRRAVTDERLRKVADIYNAAAMYGLEDVQRVLGISRATAARLVKAAREKGFISTKGRSK